MKNILIIVTIFLSFISISWAATANPSQQVAAVNNLTSVLNTILEVKEIELNATAAASKDIFRQSVIVLSDIDNNDEDGFNITISDADNTSNALLPGTNVLDFDAANKNSVPVYFECHSLLFKLNTQTSSITNEEDTSGVFTYTTAVAEGSNGAITTTNGGDAGVELEYHITSANFGNNTNGVTRWTGSGFNNTKGTNAFQGNGVSVVEHYKFNVDSSPTIAASLITDDSSTLGDNGINDSINDSTDFCLNIDDPVEATKDAILFINMYIEQEAAERMLRASTPYSETFTITITNNS